MLHRIKTAFEQHATKIVFCIGMQSYTYAEWLLRIGGIRQALQQQRPTARFIGLAAYNDIETYAAILALWAEGYAFVPLSPLSPATRNGEILQLADSRYIMSSKPPDSNLVDSTDLKWILTSGLEAEAVPPDFSRLNPGQLLCMLFTSGSTGVPKGVPYTAENINTTLDAFFALGYELGPEDRFLQLFELTFDMSLLSYLPAWCLGASVHTVGGAGFKYLQAAKVMKEGAVSFAAMVPSTLQLLRPYFSELELPALRYCLLGGEPLYVDLAKAWMDCVPNARVVNISGPCETTMACMGYDLGRDFSNNKSHKNILAFGSPWKNTHVLLVDPNTPTGQLGQNLVKVGQVGLPTGEVGELCFGGDHVMQGYWQMPEKNAAIFF